MTALLKEAMDQSLPDPDLHHQERERFLAEWRSRYLSSETIDPMQAVLIGHVRSRGCYGCGRLLPASLAVSDASESTKRP